MLTHKDNELLGLLRVNAREPVASLARKLGVSRTTVQDRLRKLETTGVIAGYGVRLGSDVSQSGIGAVILLSAEPRRQADVSKGVVKFPQVETLHAVSGKHDFMITVRAESANDIDKLIDSFTAMAGVTDVETSVILSTKVDRR
jgi:DNA-binding Lrp family transcriptional regulator